MSAKAFVVPEPRIILVVEDEFLIRHEISSALAAADFGVIEAANADEALDVLYRGTCLDLILTDLRMPGRLDGFELIRRIREQWPSLKIILRSGELAPPVDMADVFLPKPYDFSMLLSMIEDLTGLRGRSS